MNIEELYGDNALEKLQEKFEDFLSKKDPEIYKKYKDAKEFESSVVISCAPILEDFLEEFFDIKKENSALKNHHEELQKIYEVRREFVQRTVAKKFTSAPENIEGLAILKALQISFSTTEDLEKKLAAKILDEKNIEELTLYAAWALYSKEGKKLHKDGALFILPKKIDHQNLLKNYDGEKNNRDGFNLTDQGFTLNRVLGEAHYCIFCHNQKKDSCRSGIKEKNDCGNFKKDVLNTELHGCPLDQKISEMNFLESKGFSISSLAVAMIDNPMIAGTGNRICNDCMKACIYQKQDPVDIPQIETRIVKDVLSLPYGFEIYSLLTRWNPLNFAHNLPKKNSGKKILICGLGPAGYTLAHYLTQAGHEVVAIDGLKIEPLNPEISGIDEFGNRKEFKPIKSLDEIYEPLSSRLIQGFGGVAEYGITTRWDKNFLKIIRLTLERRKNFRMFGGLRFGSSITDKIAFEKYGFDHVALCIGAGRPNIIEMKNNFAKGVRMASDFLMSLQLSGAFREDLDINLQIRKPILVIGGGLTAIDAACEAKAYYNLQTKKFAKKIQKIGKENFYKNLNEEEKLIAQEFLDSPNCDEVKIVYRKSLQSSPAYRLNHFELEKAFEENVEFVENITPLEVIIDEFNHVKGLKTKDANGVEKIFDCKTLIIAAGTTPNLSPVLEDNLDLKIDGKYFESVNEDGAKLEATYSPKEKHFSIFTKVDRDHKYSVSFFGDLHPNFEGSVVKAMASAKLGYQQINKILSNQKSIEEKDFLQKINSEFSVKIEKIERLSDHVIQIFVHAPLLANQTQIGQIFRLQNYHALNKKAMEGVAVTALNIDKKNGIITGIVVETGGSTSLIQNFKSGEPCIFMGPSGTPTEIPKNEIVVLIGGGRGNQPLTAIAEAYKQNGCKIIFFAGYRKNSYVVNQNKMEKFSDELIFSIEEESPNLKLNRSSDQQIQGSVIDSLRNYFTKNQIKVDRIFTIGNDKMMNEIGKLRHDSSLDSIRNAKIAITSLNAPMQCMMKGVCSQCLQKRKNADGNFEYFYACASQDQNMDMLDFDHLTARCDQNSLLEKAVKFSSS